LEPDDIKQEIRENKGSKEEDDLFEKAGYQKVR